MNVSITTLTFSSQQGVNDMPASKQVIAVFGATGLQGGGVARALREQGKFAVRALTRDAKKVAAADGFEEVVEADLTRPESLPGALAGAYGVFLVTNFWAGPDVDEVAQGRAAIEAAKQAGVQHFVWSTLPNVKQISDGRFEVRHFTKKAEVDTLVAAAGFRYHTFVEAPFYYQNLTGAMAPHEGPDGVSTWSLPMDPESRVIHMGDATELGDLVAGAFADPARTGQGQHLSLVGEEASWNDVIETLKAQGHRVGYQRVPATAFDSAFPGAQELREMMEYFEAYTYMGPDAEHKIARAREVSPKPATRFADWARTHMVPAS
jgi:uncharacterized protein YbjT (DUF2867 family)